MMDVLIVTALAKVLTKEAKDRRSQIEPGEYNLLDQVTLDVSGTLRVGEDHDYQPTTSIPLKVALALFVRYSGATGQNAMNALVRAMGEALEIEAMPKKEKTTAIEAIRELADLEEAEQTVRTGLALLPPRPRKGTVTVKATVEELQKIDSPTIAPTIPGLTLPIDALQSA